MTSHYRKVFVEIENLKRDLENSDWFDNLMDNNMILNRLDLIKDEVVETYIQNLSE